MDVPRRVQQLLSDASAARASDVHVEPTAVGGELRFRVDGLLAVHERLTADDAAAVVARLMVLAGLLTYRRDVPQEGRATVTLAGRSVDVRVAIMPTTHGLRAAVRLPAHEHGPRTPAELGLPTAVVHLIDHFATADSGVLAVVGPAGSGKTTTAYAVLEAVLARQPGVSVVALEDPVERDVPGVTQIQVQPFGELTYAVALRSMLRQDPQVLMLGEIRDADTARTAIEAGLSGHRLVCTFHAADAAGAVARLLEMGVEPYQISGALLGVIGQRLLRRTDGTGNYRGRVPAGEAVTVDDAVRAAIVARSGAATLRTACHGSPGYAGLRDSAAALVAANVTDAAEVRRVLGESAG